MPSARKRIEQGRTDNDILKGLDRSIRLVHVIQSRDLDEPSDVVRVELIVDDPLCELVPFVRGPTVDAESPFTVLITPSFDKLRRRVDKYLT